MRVLFYKRYEKSRCIRDEKFSKTIVFTGIIQFCRLLVNIISTKDIKYYKTVESPERLGPL